MGRMVMISRAAATASNEALIPSRRFSQRIANVAGVEALAD
jgi:hypothetical protein